MEANMVKLPSSTTLACEIAIRKEKYKQKKSNLKSSLKIT